MPSQQQMLHVDNETSRQLQTAVWSTVRRGRSSTPTAVLRSYQNCSASEHLFRTRGGHIRPKYSRIDRDGPGGPRPQANASGDLKSEETLPPLALLSHFDAACH